MMRNSRANDFPTKQEGNGDNDHKAPVTSSRLWSGLKNPRIVRVSRAFGGKDRHSKVSTIRGLRDRRVRLSVPTAIQLYDLQDRLGVNQPSKVVDWLLNAAHEEIDKLPPLQLPQGLDLLQIPHESLPTALSQYPSHPLAAENFQYMNEHEPQPRLTTFPESSTYWSSDDVAAQRSKHREEDQEDGHTEKGNSTINGSNADALPRLAGPSLVSMAPYSSYYHWEATNAYLSQFGIRPPQVVEAPAMSVPSSRPLAVSDSQMFLCPQGVMPTSMFPASYFSASTDFDPKQFIQTQATASSTLQITSQQSNSSKRSLHFGGPSVRPFQ